MTTKQVSLLGEFIRSHRERITPAQVGLPEGFRRRAKGLRREEVATLCGISPTWLTWIEQGRTDSISASTLARIAEALLLTQAEKEYLFNLAGLRNPDQLASLPEPHIQDMMRQAVDHIQSPAYALDRLWNALAWNEPAQKLFIGWLDCEALHPNLLDFMFCQAGARTLVEDWATRAQRLVAEFRADVSPRLDDPEIKQTIARLQQSSSDFASFWNRHDVMGREGGERRFAHPLQGLLSYQQITLKVATSPDIKLVMLF